jgi:hypothetical protein
LPKRYDASGIIQSALRFNFTAEFNGNDIVRRPGSGRTQEQCQERD